jgi:hypothetical protein
MPVLGPADSLVPQPVSAGQGQGPALCKSGEEGKEAVGQVPGACLLPFRSQAQVSSPAGVHRGGDPALTAACGTVAPASAQHHWFPTSSWERCPRHRSHAAPRTEEGASFPSSPLWSPLSPEVSLAASTTGWPRWFPSIPVPPDRFWKALRGTIPRQN